MEDDALSDSSERLMREVLLLSIADIATECFPSWPCFTNPFLMKHNIFRRDVYLLPHFTSFFQFLHSFCFSLTKIESFLSEFVLKFYGLCVKHVFSFCCF